jgi:nitrate reductase (NAD(P)H)
VVPLLPGGGRKVTRVEVTLDGGETWHVCSLDHPERPTKYGKYWCWCFWSVDVEVLDVLGAKEIAVRAWDEAMNTQPEKLVWNLMVSCRSIVFPFPWNHACPPLHDCVSLNTRTCVCSSTRRA